jgi:hypothetical protein
MFHPLAYLVKLNIEMSMAHLIKTIALGHGHSNGYPSSTLTLTSSPDTDVFTNDIFADTPHQRQSLLCGLFAHVQDVFRHGDVRTRKPEDASVYNTTMRAHELQPRNPMGEAIRMSADGVDSKNTKKGNFLGAMTTRSNEDEAIASIHGQRISTFKPVYLPDRPLEAGP